MKKSFLLLATFAVAQIATTTALTAPALAQSSSNLVVPGKSLGKIRLGMSTAQVRKLLGKPDQSLRLRNGLTDDLYRSKKTRINGDGFTVRDKVEELYIAGRVVQIEATSPTFRTANGLSTGNTVGQLTSGAYNWRYLTYGYDHPESGWQNYYFVNVNKGVSLEFEGWQDYLFRRSQSTTLLVHRAGTRPFADVGGSLVTDTLDSSVLMADE